MEKKRKSNLIFNYLKKIIMKNLKTIGLLILLTLATVSCHKDDPTPVVVYRLADAKVYQLELLQTSQVYYKEIP